MKLFRPLALLAALAACSPQTAQAIPSETRAVSAQDDRHPVSGLEVIPLRVTQDGEVHRFRVEVAANREEQARGLMFRRELGPDEGMIFPLSPPRLASFWMKNTVIPLDIIFIGKDHRIINIAANATPYTLDPRQSEGLALAVLELPGGRAAELGIGPGALVQW